MSKKLWLNSSGYVIWDPESRKVTYCEKCPCDENHCWILFKSKRDGDCTENWFTCQWSSPYKDFSDGILRMSPLHNKPIKALDCNKENPWPSYPLNEWFENDEDLDEMLYLTQVPNFVSCPNESDSMECQRFLDDYWRYCCFQAHPDESDTVYMMFLGTTKDSFMEYWHNRYGDWNPGTIYPGAPAGSSAKITGLEDFIFNTESRYIDYVYKEPNPEINEPGIKLHLYYPYLAAIPREQALTIRTHSTYKTTWDTWSYDIQKRPSYVEFYQETVYGQDIRLGVFKKDWNQTLPLEYRMSPTWSTAIKAYISDPSPFNNVVGQFIENVALTAIRNELHGCSSWSSYTEGEYTVIYVDVQQTARNLQIPIPDEYLNNPRLSSILEGSCPFYGYAIFESHCDTLANAGSECDKYDAAEENTRLNYTDECYHRRMMSYPSRVKIIPSPKTMSQISSELVGSYNSGTSLGWIHKNEEYPEKEGENKPESKYHWRYCDYEKDKCGLFILQLDVTLHFPRWYHSTDNTEITGLISPAGMDGPDDCKPVVAPSEEAGAPMCLAPFVTLKHFKLADGSYDDDSQFDYTFPTIYPPYFYSCESTLFKHALTIIPWGYCLRYNATGPSGYGGGNNSDWNPGGTSNMPLPTTPVKVEVTFPYLQEFPYLPVTQDFVYEPHYQPLDSWERYTGYAFDGIGSPYQFQPTIRSVISGSSGSGCNGVNNELTVNGSDHFDVSDIVEILNNNGDWSREKTLCYCAELHHNTSFSMGCSFNMDELKSIAMYQTGHGGYINDFPNELPVQVSAPTWEKEVDNSCFYYGYNPDSSSCGRHEDIWNHWKDSLWWPIIRVLEGISPADVKVGTLHFSWKVGDYDPETNKQIIYYDKLGSFPPIGFNAQFDSYMTDSRVLELWQDGYPSMPRAYCIARPGCVDKEEHFSVEICRGEVKELIEDISPCLLDVIDLDSGVVS